MFDSVFTLAYIELWFIILGNVSAFEKLNITLLSPILISVMFHPRDVKLCHGFVPSNSISGICFLQVSTENFLQYLDWLVESSVADFLCRQNRMKVSPPIIAGISIWT